MILNIAILVAAWFVFKDAPQYNNGDYNEAKNWNIGILSFYLFGPFWALYFVIGIATAFLYDAYRPAEHHNAWGKSTYKYNTELEMYMRPDEANQVVAQWYFAVTRPGSFWNWWQYRKNMYWFSPQPCPVTRVSRNGGEEEEEKDTMQVMKDIIE
eukprot:15366816-Ditylum_brightwellii.AAC.1